MKTKFQNIYRKELARRYQSKLYMVDLKNDVVQRMPQGEFPIVIRPDAWEPGKVYVPPHAKIVGAINAHDARRKVEELMEGASENIVRLVVPHHHHRPASPEP